MRHQEAFSRSRPWNWLFGAFRRSVGDGAVTSIIDSQEVIREEVETVLDRYGIDSTGYRLRLLPCAGAESGDESPYPGPEEWILYVALTLRTGEIASAMTTLEKYLHRRLVPYAIRVKAVYWRMLPA